MDSIAGTLLTLVEGAPEAIVVMGTSGNLVWLNPRARDLLGGDATTTDHILQAVIQKQDQIREMGKAGVLDVPVCFPGGRRRLFRVSDWGETADSRLHLLVVRDASVESSVELGRSRLARLEAAQQAAGMLLHDVRNSVASVLAGLENLENASLGSDETFIVRLILSEARGLARTVEGLRGAFASRPICVKAIALEELASLAAGPVRERASRIRVRLAISDGPKGLNAYVDPRVMMTALKNLMNDLIGRCVKGDTAEISWGRLEDDQRAIVAPGFPGSVVFLAARCSADTPRVPKDSPGTDNACRACWDTGESLGVSLACRIVESHGGAVLLQRDGSEDPGFRLLLPAGEPPICWQVRANCPLCQEPKGECCASCDVRAAAESTPCWAGACLPSPMVCAGCDVLAAFSLVPHVLAGI